jgi:hypothetical protein
VLWKFGRIYVSIYVFMQKKRRWNDSLLKLL